MSFRSHRARLTPLALATLMALGASSLNAAPRTFIGGSSFWDVSTNWSGGILPGLGDDALLGAFNTEVRTSFTINSFIGTGSLTVSAGTLSFAAASSIGSLIQTGGTLAGTGNLTVAGATTLSGGQMVGSGETLLNGALTMTNFAGIGLDDGRVLRIAGGATLSNNSFQLNFGNTGNASAGRIVNAAGSTITDNSSNGSAFNSNNFGGVENGLSASFTNLGTYTKTGAGNTSFAVALNNSGTLNVNAGTVTLSAGSTHSGSINTAAGATLNLSSGTHALSNAAGITNAGTLQVAGGTVNMGGNLDSAGLLAMTSGTLNLGAGTHQAALFTMGGGLLTGTGSFTVTGGATLNGGQMTGTGETLFNGALGMGNFASFSLDEGRTLRINAGATLSNNSFQLNPNSTGNAAAGRIVNAAGSTITDNSSSGSGFNSNNFGGIDNGSSASFTNLGTYTKTGVGNSTIGVTFINNGTVNAAGGTLSLNRGVTGTGTLATAGSGSVLLGAASSVGTLQNNGSGASALNLQSFTVTVSGDYDSASFGSGNSFNRRANVAVSGAAGNRIIAAGDVNQALAGAQVGNGNGTAPTLTFGNVHVGTTTRSYEIVNVGTTGPVLRGAVQTTAGGANVSDGRLSGSGVTAANWGPVAAGSALARNVTLNVAAAGSYAPLSGQAVNIVNNFDNTRSQLLTITSSAGAAAYNLAAAGTVSPNPVTLANQRVGMALAGALTLTNTAPAGSFTEGLNASFGALTGNALTNGGSVSLLAGGASNGSAMALRVDTSTAGSKSGTAQVLLASDGTGTSGLGLTALSSQTVTVGGDVFRLATASAASPAALMFNNVRQGTGALQTITLSNTALADGFSEGMNASIIATSGFSASGSFSLLAAGASSSALLVSMNTSTAGARSGTATITLASDGSAAGNSGFGAIGIGTQVVNLSGGVFRLASASAATPNPVALANQRVGGTLSQLITIGNTAAVDGFSEGLNATITANGTATAAGSFSLLAAGASSNALSVGVDTLSAGAKGGTATITLASDGAGTSGFAAFGIGTQTLSVTGSVFRLASASAVTPAAVTFADQRIGGGLLQSLSLGNTALADGFSERLNASITASGTATAAGSFSLLAAGASSTALGVGVNTASAGAKSGVATITLASDGSGTSGFAAFGLTAQTVNVSGNVFRLAQPVVDTTPLVMIARVGDAGLNRSIGISNSAPDLFTERLNASIASNPAGTNAGPALVGLVPNASGNLLLSLPTTTAGNFSGPVGVALISSSAGTTSGAPDFSLGSVNVGLTGRIYAPAVAQVAPTVVNFGTVRVGDVVAARTVTVGNTATGALTDTLRATLSGGSAPFTASGTVANLAAGASNSTGLQVQLATASAGVFTGLATLASTSQNPDLADSTLAPVDITLQGQVNNLAQVALAQAGGPGTFSGGAFTYTLDFGTVITESGSLTAQLLLGNAAVGTADALAGSWVLGAGGGAFSVAGFGPFSGLAAGATLAGLTVTFDLGTEGSFNRVLMLSSLSTNGSGPDLTLGSVTLQLQGTVAAIPEPGTYLMMAVGVLMMGGIARRKLRAQQR